MIIGKQQKLTKEIIKNNPDSVVNSINQLMDDFYNLVDKKVDEANSASQIIVITVTTPSTYPVMDDIKFKSTLKNKAIGCNILQAVKKSDFSPVETMNPAWTDNAGTITIKSISGLVASQKYLITFRIV